MATPINRLAVFVGSPSDCEEEHAIVRDRSLNQLIISLCEEAGTLTAGMVLMLGASRIFRYSTGDSVIRRAL